MPQHEPHPWQLEVARLVAEENIILNAETGSGKTKVAILAMDAARRRSPGKKCIFLTPTRILAHQQYCTVVQELPGTRVAEITGYTAGNWGDGEWHDAFKKFDVLVGTPEEVRKAIVDRGYWRTEDISLLVLDECHHASKKNQMAQLLLHMHKNGSSTTTRVLGLTGSFSSGAQQASDPVSSLEKRRKDLEGLLCAQMVCPAIPKQTEPSFAKVQYAVPPVELFRRSEGIKDQLFRSLHEADVKEKHAKKIAVDLVKVLIELGPEAFWIALTKGLLAQVATKIDEYARMTQTQKLVPEFEQLAERLERFVRESVGSATIHEELQAFDARSDKLRRLEDLVGEMLRTGNDSGIVFVQEVALAIPLAAILSQRFRRADEEGGPLIGVSTGTGSMLERDRNEAFAHFRHGHTRVLVTTPCSEEGVDISTCAFVVSFSGYTTTKSHVQRAGRARKAGAQVYLFENDPTVENERAALMQSVARDPVLRQSPEDLDRHARALAHLAHLHLEGLHPFVLPGSAAVVSFANAGRLFSDYCEKVTRGRAGSADALLLRSEAGDVVALAVPGPEGGCLLPVAAVEGFFGGAVPQDKDVALQTKLHYVAVLLLHAKGWLTEHNKPTDEAESYTVWPEKGASGSQLLHLCLADYTREALGEVTQPLPTAEFMPSDLGGGRRDREFREPTQQVTLDTLLLDPAMIRNTQRTVNRTFSKGGSVLRAMMGIVNGTTSPDDFPPIRVAHGPPSSAEENKCYYSADNRRVFTYKVVAPLCGLETVQVQLINWTVEFDGKLRQEPRMGETWMTDDASITEVRWLLLRALRAQEDGDEEELARLLGEMPGDRDTPRLDDSDFDDEDETGWAAAAAMLGRLANALGGAPKPALAPQLVERLRAAAGGGPAGRAPLGRRRQRLEGEGEGEGEVASEEEEGSDSDPAVPAVASGHLAQREGGLPLRLGGCGLTWVGVGLPPEHSGLPRDRSLGAGSASVAVGVRPPVQQPPEPPPPPRPEDEEERVFQRLRITLAAEPLRAHHMRDAVSTVNLLLQGLHRPHSMERIPVEYTEGAHEGGGFVVTVKLCGRVFRGQPARRKDMAKQEAARAALRALAGRGAGRPAGEAAAVLDVELAADASAAGGLAEVAEAQHRQDLGDDVRLQVRVQMPLGDVRTSHHLRTESVGQMLAQMELPPLELIEVLCRGYVVHTTLRLAEVHAWADGDVLLELRMAGQW